MTAADLPKNNPHGICLCRHTDVKGQPTWSNDTAMRQNRRRNTQLAWVNATGLAATVALALCYLL